MSSRAEYRREFRTTWLPRIDEAAGELGFARVESTGSRWRWKRAQSELARAEVSLTEMTGRHTSEGIDLQARGSIVLDDVEAACRERAERPSNAATLSAPLRSYGLTYARDASYPLRWTGSPALRIDEIVGDLRSFAVFAATVRSVADLTPERLARSRIRRHVEQGLSPNYAIPLVADVIAEMQACHPVSPEE